MLANTEQVFKSPVTYMEVPLRTVCTTRVSSYAAYYLKTISRARLQQQTGGWPPWTPQWWKEREEEALGALASLRDAVEIQASEEPQP